MIIYCIVGNQCYSYIYIQMMTCMYIMSIKQYLLVGVSLLPQLSLVVLKFVLQGCPIIGNKTIDSNETAPGQYAIGRDHKRCGIGVTKVANSPVIELAVYPAAHVIH